MNQKVCIPQQWKKSENLSIQSKKVKNNLITKPAETWVFCFNVIFILNYFHFAIVILYLKTIFENRNNLKNEKMENLTSQRIAQVNAKHNGAKTKFELVELAKEKRQFLTGERSMIRLTADEKSYWIIKMDGQIFIGFFYNESLSKIYKNKDIYFYNDFKVGNGVIALGEFQLLGK